MYSYPHQTIRKQHCGFSLLELLTGVAIAGLTLAVALPNFGDFNDNNKLRSNAREFQGLILLARTEAVKRNTIVNLTSTLEDDWSGEINLCSAPSAATQCGAENTTSIKVKTIAADGVTIKSSATGNPNISFNSRGRLTGGVAATTVTLSFCDLRLTDAGNKAKVLSINVTGRPSIEGLDVDQGHSCDPN